MWKSPHRLGLASKNCPAYIWALWKSDMLWHSSAVYRPMNPMAWKSNQIQQAFLLLLCIADLLLPSLWTAGLGSVHKNCHYCGYLRTLKFHLFGKHIQLVVECLLKCYFILLYLKGVRSSSHEPVKCSKQSWQQQYENPISHCFTCVVAIGCLCFNMITWNILDVLYPSFIWIRTHSLIYHHRRNMFKIAVCTMEIVLQLLKSSQSLTFRNGSFSTSVMCLPLWVPVLVTSTAVELKA